MRRRMWCANLAGIALLLVMGVGAAHAQATRTWISGVGDDVNPCSRTAPCKTFPGAISKTAAGGEIDTLDPGGFGGVTVTKAMTLSNEGIGEAGILVAGTNGVTINCVSDPNCTVVLRGLQIDGGPIGSNSLAGVRFYAGGKLIIENCVIRNFTGGSPNGYGVAFTPSGPASLFISNTTISNNGQPGSNVGGGIFIQPSGSASASVTLSRVNVVNNTYGVNADASLSAGTVSVAISDSVVANNAKNGIFAYNVSGGYGQTMMNVNRTIVNGNAIGLVSRGPSVLRFGSSVVTNNNTLARVFDGASMTSYGNNQIDDNAHVGDAFSAGALN